MDNPWIVHNRLCDTLMSVQLNTRLQSADFRKSSYIRPMVLLFPDEPTATDFSKHAKIVRRSCVILQNRRSNDEIQNNLSTKVNMVLVKMPEPPNETVDDLVDILTPCTLDTYASDRLLSFSMVTYALFLYVNRYRINAEKNMEIDGVVINPVIELADRGLQMKLIIQYLNKMFNK